MRTQTMRATHGICGWGVILVGILVVFGPSVAAAEMPRAVYYDTTQLAKVIGEPADGFVLASPRPAPTADRPADDPPEPCMSPERPRAIGVAARLSDLLRP